MSFALGETVVVSRRSGATQDADGNDVDVFTDTEYKGVSIGPGTTLEVNDAQNLITSEIHAIFQPGISLTGSDKIRVTTGPYIGTYPIDGLPKHYRSPFTGLSATDAILKGATG